MHIFPFFLLSAALLTLAGCGGSTEPATTDTSTVNPLINEPSNNDTSNAGQGSDLINDTSTNSSDANVTNASQELENNDSQNDVETTATQSSDTYCEATSASVSYESYCDGSSRCNGGNRVYVPFPASGFSWDGAQVCDFAASYGVDPIHMLVPFVSRRPDIDGNRTDAAWDSAVIAGTSDYETTRNNIDNLLVASVPDYLDGAGYSTWSAMHDGTNLYIEVKVSSDSLASVYSDSEQPWNDDSLELFLDGDNSKGLEYDGVNDFQAVLRATSKDWQPFIPSSSPQSLGIFYRTAARLNNGFGLNYEIAINLESAGIEIGKPFGFDVHINEDDNGDERDAKWGWFEKTGLDRSWLQPAVFGTLMLTDCADRNACGSYQVVSE